MPSARARATASEPMKPVSSLQHQPRPASIGLRSVGEVVAVEVEADLEPQRVAGAEAGRHGAARRAARPRAPAPPRARSGARPRPRPCSRSRRRALGAGDRAASRCACAAAARRRASSADDRARLAGPARRASRSRRSRSRHLGVEVGGVLGEPGEVALVVGGVGDRQVAVVGEPVGEQVVEHAAVLAAEAASTARRRPRAWRRRWRAAAAAASSAPGPGGLDLAHVRDVEHPAGGAHREVLVADPLVLDRHLPARERDQRAPAATCAS